MKKYFALLFMLVIFAGGFIFGFKCDQKLHPPADPVIISKTDIRYTSKVPDSIFSQPIDYQFGYFKDCALSKINLDGEFVSPGVFHAFAENKCQRSDREFKIGVGSNSDWVFYVELGAAALIAGGIGYAGYKYLR